LSSICRAVGAFAAAKQINEENEINRTEKNRIKLAKRPLVKFASDDSEAANLRLVSVKKQTPPTLTSPT